MFDGRGEDAVGDAGEGARKKILGVGYGGGGLAGGGVGDGELAAGQVEGAELDGDLRGGGLVRIIDGSEHLICALSDITKRKKGEKKPG